MYMALIGLQLAGYFVLKSAQIYHAPESGKLTKLFAALFLAGNLFLVLIYLVGLNPQS